MGLVEGDEGIESDEPLERVDDESLGIIEEVFV